jgi:hypothetical protein
MGIQIFPYTYPCVACQVSSGVRIHMHMHITLQDAVWPVTGQSHGVACSCPKSMPGTVSVCMHAPPPPSLSSPPLAVSVAPSACRTVPLGGSMAPVLIGMYALSPPRRPTLVLSLPHSVPAGEHHVDSHWPQHAPGHTQIHHHIPAAPQLHHNAAAFPLPITLDLFESSTDGEQDLQAHSLMIIAQHSMVAASHQSSLW